MIGKQNENAIIENGWSKNKISLEASVVSNYVLKRIMEILLKCFKLLRFLLFCY